MLRTTCTQTDCMIKVMIKEIVCVSTTWGSTLKCRKTCTMAADFTRKVAVNAGRVNFFSLLFSA